MSHTSSSAIATCTLKGVHNQKDAVTLYVDWLMVRMTTAPDDIPEYLDGMTREEMEDEVSSYVEANENGEVTVTLDTEGDDGNWNQEVFDSICKHFSQIQVSDLLKIEWSTFDSRDGTSATTSYYDQNGEWVDIESGVKDSKALDKLADLLSGKEWDSDTLLRVAEIIRETGRSVEDVA